MSRLSQEAAISAAILQSFDFKGSVRVATTASVTLATLIAGSVVDGEVLVAGNRILIKDQASASENGIYEIQSASAPVRTSDADDGTKLTAGSLVVVEEGSTNGDTGWLLTTNDPITIGVTSLNWIQVFPGAVGGGTTDKLSVDDQGIAALATTSDEDPAIAGGITNTPIDDGNVFVFVNGVQVSVGDGVKTKECYFADPGAPSVARLIQDIQAGDSLRWIGSVAGYELSILDKITFLYVV